jgi:hypothetical protein
MIATKARTVLEQRLRGALGLGGGMLFPGLAYVAEPAKSDQQSDNQTGDGMPVQEYEHEEGGIAGLEYKGNEDVGGDGDGRPDNEQDQGGEKVAEQSHGAKNTMSRAVGLN